MKEASDKTVLRWNSRLGWSMHGELSFARVPTLKNNTHFIRDSGAPDCVDLKDVQRTDSAGIALLLYWALLARRTGHKLALKNIHPQVRSLARLYGIEELLPIQDQDTAEAPRSG